MKTLRVLLIDDNPVNLRLGAKVLKALGHQGFLVASAQNALSLLEQETVDLIFLDASMPVMDGYAFLRHLRTQAPGHLSQIPVVMLSAFDAPEETPRAKAAGANAYMEKPMTEDKARQVLRELRLV